MNANRSGAAPESPAYDDPRLLAAVKEFQAAYESGRRPSRRVFLRKYPEIAPELWECLEGLSLLHAVGERLLGNHGETH
jgi:eukaryotic-like serine/threonine-protein kinase